MTNALSHADTLGRYLGAFVDELVAQGLRHVCLCPGSRSTPLALTFARHPGVKVWTHLDERSCAYFALGMSKAGAEPVAILCSSGTAAVNFAPAVVEAYESRVPLLVLTADRPQELRDLGANQTIDQVRLYGSHARWFVELPLPEATDEALRYVRHVAARALATTVDEPRGPVHLNFPFREPLVPTAYEHPGLDSLARVTTAVTASNATVPDAVLEDIASAQRGVIVCGASQDADPEAVIALSQCLSWPVLADPLSGLRCTPAITAGVISSYDNFIRVPALVASLTPDFVLRIGDPPTSKPLATYLQRHRGVRQLQLAPPGRWPDPELDATNILHIAATPFCRDAVSRLEPRPREDGWLDAWQEAERQTRGAIAAVLAPERDVVEPTVFADLADVLPEGAVVFAGNSMPVRDLDSFFPGSARQQTFYANRGASGIDGVVSTALGVAAVSEQRVVLVIGDLSFYHDMNGLLAAGRHHLNATIVLINNDGGGIFSFLPQNSDQEHFELLFGTPHGLDFAAVAQLYGVGFDKVASRQEYRDALKASFESAGVRIIEVRTDRKENLALHQRIWDEVAASVSIGAPQ